MIETVMAVLSGVDTVLSLYGRFTGVATGEEALRALQVLQAQRIPVERLSDRVLYAGSVEQAVNPGVANLMSSPGEAKQLLEPLATVTGTDLLGTAVAVTPEKLRSAFRSNPWTLLLEPRPLHRAARPNNPDLVPIMFTEGGTPYLGWQLRGALPMLCGCEFHELSSSRVVTAPASVSSSPPATASQSGESFEAGLSAFLSQYVLSGEANGLILDRPPIVLSNGLKCLATWRWAGDDQLLFTSSGLVFSNRYVWGHAGLVELSYMDFMRRTLSRGRWFISFGEDQWMSAPFRMSDVMRVLQELQLHLLKTPMSESSES